MNRSFDWLAVSFLFTAIAVGQSPPGLVPDEPVDAPPPPSPLDPTTTATADLLTEAREQSIYLPYDKLWEVFEQEGRGVFLPYEQFRDLWEAKLAHERPDADQPPPVGARIAEVDGLARVGEDVVTFTATISCELLSPGWHEIPLRLHDVSVMEATLDDAPARLRFVDGEGYRLLVRHEGEEPRMEILKVHFATPYKKEAGLNSVSFHGPISPVNRWDLRIPEAGVEVLTIHPLLAAAEVENPSTTSETRVLAFVGSTPQVQFSWKPEAEGAMGLGAVASVRAEQQVTIGEGVTRTQARLTYTISRTELSALSIEVPQDQKVVGVFDPNVKQWSVEVTDDAQRVNVQLFEPVKGTQTLRIDLEQYGNADPFDVPVLTAMNVGRQQGIIALNLSAGLRAEVTDHQGLLQLDSSDLPATLQTLNPAFAYRYVTVPYTLRLGLGKIQPRVEVETLVESHLGPEEIVLDVFAVFNVQRAGVFDLGLTLPDAYEVRSVDGAEASGVRAAAVDRHFVHREEGSPPQLRVSLAAKAKGLTGLAVKLRRALQEPDLLAPTGNRVSIPMDLPRATGENLERERGNLVVYAPESLSIDPEETRGLRPIPFKETIRKTRLVGAQGKERPVLSFAYGNDETALTLSVERRSPNVTARQLLSAAVESGVIKYRSTLFYDIRYSAVESLRLDVPTDSAPTIRVTSPGLRREVLDGAEVEPGYTAWRIAGEAEFLDNVRVDLQWEDTIGRLEIGQPVAVDIPRIIPRETDRDWGQIVISKAEAIDVVPTDRQTGLRAIDPRYDLMPGAPVSEGAMAFQYHDAWGLTVQATRYETKDVKATSVERGLVRAVLTRGKVTSVQAVYRIVSARQRLVVELPEGSEFDSQPLRLNGRPVSPEVGDNPQQYYVPLVGVEQGKPFLLELRYSHPQKGWALRGPEFVQEPAVQQVFFSVYVPRNRVFLGARGPWDDEMIWVIKDFNHTRRPRADRSDAHLIDWVRDGLEVDTKDLVSFPTDGMPLCFSTLRPPVGSKGALRLTIAARWFVHFLVLAIIIGIGIRHLSTPLNRRAIVIGSWLIALIVLSVFMPSLVLSLVSTAAMAAGATVLIIWGLWYFLFILPKSPVNQALRELAEEKRRAGAAPAAEPPPIQPPEGADGQPQEEENE